MRQILTKMTAYIALAAFVLTSVVPPSYAQSVSLLPIPGNMVGLSTSFTPVVLRGMKVDPQNPFKFDFVVDPGDSGLQGDALKDESTRLVRYFLAAVTTPEKDLWVNLSPYESDRIIPESFGMTEMGRDLLSQDYILKQITSSLMYPEGEAGKVFWAKVYSQAYSAYGTTDVPVDTFNKVWITPDKAEVYEDQGVAFVGESHLKVMLESDYLAMSNVQATDGSSVSPTADMTKQLMREIMIPLIEKEVNEGKNFTQLRQVYQSLILSVWYKKRLKDSVLSQVYADRNKVAGVDIQDKKESEKIWAQYVAAFKKGVYSYIKEEVDEYTQETIPRKYFSGGVNAAEMFKVVSFKPLLQKVRSIFYKGLVIASFIVLASNALGQAQSIVAPVQDQGTGAAQVTAPRIAEFTNATIDAWAKVSFAGQDDRIDPSHPAAQKHMKIFNDKLSGLKKLFKEKTGFEIGDAGSLWIQRHEKSGNPEGIETIVNLLGSDGKILGSCQIVQKFTNFLNDRINVGALNVYMVGEDGQPNLKQGINLQEPETSMMTMNEWSDFIGPFMDYTNNGWSMDQSSKDKLRDPFQTGTVTVTFENHGFKMDVELGWSWKDGEKRLLIKISNGVTTFNLEEGTSEFMQNLAVVGARAATPFVALGVGAWDMVRGSVDPSVRAKAEQDHRDYMWQKTGPLLRKMMEKKFKSGKIDNRYFTVDELQVPSIFVDHLNEISKDYLIGEGDIKDIQAHIASDSIDPVYFQAFNLLLNEGPFYMFLAWKDNGLPDYPQTFKNLVNSNDGKNGTEMLEKVKEVVAEARAAVDKMKQEKMKAANKGLTYQVTQADIKAGKALDADKGEIQEFWRSRTASVVVTDFESGRKGSQEGGMAKIDGKPYYVKFYENEDRMRAEWLSWMIYRQVGIPVVDEMVVVDVNGRKGIASSWVEGSSVGGLDPYQDKKLLALEFVAAAFIQDRDRGTEENYLNTKDGKVAIDFGGSAMYTGTGGIKGQMGSELSFGVEHFKQMMTEGWHRNKRFYETLAEEDIREAQIEFVRELSPELLSDMIDAVDLQGQGVRDQIMGVYSESLDYLRSLDVAHVEYGGIDLDPAGMNMSIKGDGSIKINAIDPAIFAQFEAAPGLIPVNIGIRPAGDLPAFFGLSAAVDDQTSVVASS